MDFYMYVHNVFNYRFSLLYDINFTYFMVVVWLALVCLFT